VGTKPSTSGGEPKKDNTKGWAICQFLGGANVGQASRLPIAQGNGWLVGGKCGQVGGCWLDFGVDGGE
jgi:hypothetical protein